MVPALEWMVRNLRFGLAVERGPTTPAQTQHFHGNMDNVQAPGAQPSMRIMLENKLAAVIRGSDPMWPARSKKEVHLPALHRGNITRSAVVQAITHTVVQPRNVHRHPLEDSMVRLANAALLLDHSRSS